MAHHRFKEIEQIFTVLRFILAILIGFSLAVTPVVSAVAKPVAAMEHCDKQDMGAKDMGAKDMGAKDMGAKDMGAKDMGDCPCCDKGSACATNACATNACASMCAKVPVALTTALKTLVFLRQLYEPASNESVALNAWPPPAPPPRV